MVDDRPVNYVEVEGLYFQKLLLRPCLLAGYHLFVGHCCVWLDFLLIKVVPSVLLSREVLRLLLGSLDLPLFTGQSSLSWLFIADLAEVRLPVLAARTKISRLDHRLYF